MRDRRLRKDLAPSTHCPTAKVFFASACDYSVPLEYSVDRFEEVRRGHVSNTIWDSSPAHNSSCSATCILASLYIGFRVTDHPRHFEIQMTLLSCSQQHAGRWFPASAARLFFVWAIVDSINDGAGAGKLIAHPLMQHVEAGGGDQSLSNTALVTHNNHTKASLVEQGNGFGDTGEYPHVSPTGHVFTVARFL